MARLCMEKSVRAARLAEELRQRLRYQTVEPSDCLGFKVSKGGAAFYVDDMGPLMIYVPMREESDRSVPHDVTRALIDMGVNIHLIRVETIPVGSMCYETFWIKD